MNQTLILYKHNAILKIQCYKNYNIDHKKVRTKKIPNVFKSIMYVKSHNPKNSVANAPFERLFCLA